MQRLKVSWQGWTCEINGRKIGHVEARTANGMTAVLDADFGLPGWVSVTTDSVAEAYQHIQDYAEAIADAVEFGDFVYRGAGQFEASPLEPVA